MSEPEYAGDILTEHMLLTHTRSGQAACRKEGCEWRTSFAVGRDRTPDWVMHAFAEHQLELLEGVGFVLVGTTKADKALRRIEDEVRMIRHGAVVTGDCGPVWVEPIYPVPRGVQAIEEILKGLQEA